MSALESTVTRAAPPATRRPGGFINRYATPLTTGLFLVSMVSGVALFFHWAGGAFHAMHEWMSMVLLAPFALHVWKNWAALLGYLKRGTLVIPLALSLLVALPFAYQGLTGAAGGRGGNPAFRAASLLTHAHLTDLAPLLHTTPDALADTLRHGGYTVRGTDDTLDAIAAAAGQPSTAVLAAVLPTRQGG